LLCAPLIFVALTINAYAQLEVSGGWTHLSGNFGLDGFHGGAGYQFTRHVTLVGQADFVWDTSKIGAFDLSRTSANVRIKSNEQNYLGGARIRFIGWKPMKVLEKRKLLPFGEFLIGVSRLHQEVTNIETTAQELSASDQAFTWVIGGGVDYTLNRKWLARGNIDFVRTHFVDEGQSRYRIHVGLAYSF
jgi:opacity protein-like surface antigen